MPRWQETAQGSGPHPCSTGTPPCRTQGHPGPACASATGCASPLPRPRPGQPPAPESDPLRHGRRRLRQRTAASPRRRNPTANAGFAPRTAVPWTSPRSARHPRRPDGRRWCRSRGSRQSRRHRGGRRPPAPRPHGLPRPAERPS